MTGLVDAWNNSRTERTWMRPGERVHSHERAWGRVPTRSRARSERRDHGRDLRREHREHGRGY